MAREWQWCHVKWRFLWLSDVRDEEGMNLSDSERAFDDYDKDAVAVDYEVLHPIFGSVFGTECNDSWDGISIPN